MRRIVRIGATCNNKWRRKNSIRVSFIFFNLHSMFWFWLRLLFHFELVFQWNLWDFNEIDCQTRTCGINLLKRVLDFLQVLFSRAQILIEDEKVEWTLRCVGLELEDNPFDYKVCPKKKTRKKKLTSFFCQCCTQLSGWIGIFVKRVFSPPRLIFRKLLCIITYIRSSRTRNKK